MIHRPIYDKYRFIRMKTNRRYVKRNETKLRSQFRVFSNRCFYHTSIVYSIPRRGGSEGENGDKEEGGSRSISRPVVRERRPAMLCATFGTKQTAEIEWKEKRSRDTLLAK